MRILLVSPRGEFLGGHGDFGEYVRRSREMQTILHYWNGIGATLPTVASLVSPEHEIAIVDENFERLDFDGGWDVVGITAITQQAPRAYEIAGEFRRRGAHVAMGGIHATALPEEAGRHVDTVFVGEAEQSWRVFLRDLERSEPGSLYHQKAFPPVDLTQFPAPRYDLVGRYPYPVVWIQAGRGCRHDCEFCSASRVYGARPKHKTVAQVVTEVQAAKRIWKYAQIGFADDNLFQDRGYARRLVGELKKANVTWYAQTDISVGRDQGLLLALREAGCRILFIGLESARRRNLAGTRGTRWKDRMYDHYAEYIHEIQRHGIGVYGAFILGLDGDDPGVVQETIDFIDRNHLMGAQITILTPLPGSRLRTRLLHEGRVLHEDWSEYGGWTSVIRHPNFTKEQLDRSLLAVYQRIYSVESYKRRARYFHALCRELPAPASS